MPYRRTTTWTVTGLLALPMLAIMSWAPASLWAQGAANAGFIRVIMLRPIPSETSNLERALADVGKAVGAAGVPFWHVYQSVRGPAGFMVVEVDRDFSRLPPLQANNADALARVRMALAEAPNMMTLRMSGDLSAGQMSATAAPPGEFMRVRWTATAPANRDVMVAWQRDELLPALRKAGGHRRAGRVEAGGNTNQFVEFMYGKELGGDLGIDLQKSLGETAFSQLLARYRQLAANEQIHWYRFRGDLSFSTE